jgi:hypothetical protein
MKIDIDDFFLMTGPLPEPEYMWVQLSMLPQKTIDHFDVMKYAVNGRVLIRIDFGMYGLPQAAILASERLFREVLQPAGFYECPHTPAFYKHKTRQMKFGKTVDDFGVEYIKRADAEFLITELEKLYTLKVDWDPSEFLGMSLKFDYESSPRTLDVSMEGYIHKLVQRFGSELSAHGVHSAGGFIQPTYGQTGPPMVDAPIPPAPPLTADKITLLKQFIGAALFYVRCADPTAMHRLTQLASEQAHGTEATWQAAMHLLQYLRTYPNATIRYVASDMILNVHSDGSGHGANGVVAAYYFLGSAFNPNNPTKPNGAVLVECNRLRIVTAAVSETEYAALFKAGQGACSLRNTLNDFGFTQPATPIQGDNTCANGIANDTVKQKRSKAMDTRLHWIRDRVRQGQFIIYWRPGEINLADFFTKNHSAAHTKKFRQLYVRDGPLHPVANTARSRHKARNILARIDRQQ